MNVVHVEDDKPLKEILRTALRAADPQINLLQFVTADEAVKYILQNRDLVDLVIMDIRLPGELNGLQAAELLRKMNYKANLILTSAYTRPTFDVLNALDTEFFSKPWHIVDITRKMLKLKLSIFQKRNFENRSIGNEKEQPHPQTDRTPPLFVKKDSSPITLKKDSSEQEKR